ncbi:MAG: ECF-type sigma factor [Myxococcota bacterium]
MPRELSDTTYAHLRAIAGRYLKGRPGHTLQPTALVNEAYLKLEKREAGGFESREHFMAVAARVMRHILVDHARRKNADKRGGGRERTTLSRLAIDERERTLDVLDLDEALTALADLDARHAQVVELKVFAGMTSPEMARVLGVSVATVERDWVKARAWLRVRMGES